MAGSYLLANGIALINMGRDRLHCLSWRKPGLYSKRRTRLISVSLHWYISGMQNSVWGTRIRRAPGSKRHIAETGAIGDSWLLSFALNNLGEVARTLGQYDRARSYYEQSESLLRSIDDKGDLARLIHTLGYIAQYEEDFELGRIPVSEKPDAVPTPGQSSGNRRMSGWAGRSESAAGTNRMGSDHAQRGGVRFEDHRRRLVARRPCGGGTES